MKDLVDRIYECAFVPERWPDVCETLAHIGSGRGAFLFTAEDEDVRWLASPAMQEGVSRFAAGGFFERSSLFDRGIAARHAGFLTEVDIYRDGEWEEDCLCRDLLRPSGLGRFGGTVVEASTGDFLYFAVQREWALGPMERQAIDALNALRPHLARTALIASRLRLECARAASEALAAIGLPALVFDASGRVLSTNGLIDALPDVLRWVSGDRVALIDRRADKQWQEVVPMLARGALVAPLSFAIRRANASAALVAHVVPVRLEARDIFARAAGVLVLSPVTAPDAPPVELVQSLFDLTPAEARVARHLASGMSVDEIATGSDVSVATVRTHVRGVLEKTGSRRQAEAVALLTGLAAPRR